MTKTKDLSIKQIKAIRKSLEVGMILQTDFPEIAEDFRNGLSALGIVSKYNLTSRYEITRDIAKEGVLRALKGTKGRFFEMDYDGLIKEEERKRIVEEHASEQGRRRAFDLYEKGLGIFSLSEEELEEIHREGGRVGGRRSLELRVGIHGITKERKIEIGRRNYESKVGCHAQTHEQFVKSGKKAGLASAISRGIIPWSSEELEFAYNLSQDPNYRGGIYIQGNRINNKLIAGRINEVYHEGKPIRNSRSVYSGLKRLKVNT